jgi:hypothetical protein
MHKRPLLPLLIIVLLASLSFSSEKKIKKTTSAAAVRKIQVALLLDVSNSMDGLINQAKAQLWNMVTTLGKAQCNDNVVPQVEVAIYEYGRTDNEVAKGYVKKLSDFTQDLDSVSNILFGLTTQGGEEYCGQVIFNSLDELNWNNNPNEYKVIFIAGNEDFLQGKLSFTKACQKAKEKGVIVNTIYCGDKMRGIAEHWDLGGECGGGSFTNINSNVKDIDVATPYDSALMVLNVRLNGTYIGYGSLGASNVARQAKQDEMAYAFSTKAGAKRAEAKAMSNTYNNASWDLVDAMRADSTYYKKIDKATLPDSLKNKTIEEVKGVILQKTAERYTLQQQILKLNASRSLFIATEKAKNANVNGDKTLETAVEAAIREQAKRYNMIIIN